MTKTVVVAADGVDPLVNHLEGYNYLLFMLNLIVSLMVTVDVHPER